METADIIIISLLVLVVITSTSALYLYFFSSKNNEEDTNSEDLKRINENSHLFKLIQIRYKRQFKVLKIQWTR